MARGALEIKKAVMGWLAENELSTLVEEGEDILDGLEGLNTNGLDGVTDEVLLDVTEIVTALIMTSGMENTGSEEVFLMEDKGESNKKAGRAERMKKMREK